MADRSFVVWYPWANPEENEYPHDIEGFDHEMDKYSESPRRGRGQTGGPDAERWHGHRPHGDEGRRAPSTDHGQSGKMR